MTRKSLVQTLLESAKELGFGKEIIELLKKEVKRKKSKKVRK